MYVRIKCVYSIHMLCGVCDLFSYLKKKNVHIRLTNDGSHYGFGTKRGSVGIAWIRYDVSTADVDKNNSGFI